VDVTPTAKMFEAMSSFTTAVCGEAPMKIEKSPGAERIRANRLAMMDFMHRLVHLAMREGAARAMNPHRTGMGRIELPRHNG
jgi:hypothetical protein